jgi:hypothetical protein
MASRAATVPIVIQLSGMLPPWCVEVEAAAVAVASTAVRERLSGSIIRQLGLCRTRITITPRSAAGRNPCAISIINGLFGLLTTEPNREVGDTMLHASHGRSPPS